MKMCYTKLLFIGFLTMTQLHAQQRIFLPGKCKVLTEDNLPTAYIDTIFKGKQALKLDGTQQSLALLENVEAKNFRVEMDIAGQVMAGLGFHATDGFNHQFIYFRPGMGGTREAIQYIPIYNGALSWVFYNYPYYETEADVQSLEWLHAVFEVRGQNLKVFVNDEEKPSMDIDILDNPKSGGKLLLRSLFGPSYFANVTYEPLPDESPKVKASTNKGFLTEWEISRQFPRDTIPGYFDRLVQKANSASDWNTINEAEDNYVNFARYFEYPQGVLVAKTTLKSEERILKKLHFDFVGRIKVFLNGQELFDYHKIKFERMFDGTFTIGLPLDKGNNELLIIAEGDAAFFGKGFRYLGRDQHTNWGFIARLEE